MEKHIDEGVDFQMFCRVGDKKYAAYYFRTATVCLLYIYEKSTKCRDYIIFVDFTASHNQLSRGHQID